MSPEQAAYDKLANMFRCEMSHDERQLAWRLVDSKFARWQYDEDYDETVLVQIRFEGDTKC